MSAQREPQGRPDRLPGGHLPHLPSWAGPVGYSRNKLDLAGSAIPRPWGSEAIGPFAKGTTLGLYLRPFSGRVVEFSELPGFVAHLGPFHTWRPLLLVTASGQSSELARPWGEKGDRGMRRSKISRRGGLEPLPLGHPPVAQTSGLSFPSSGR
jgi:hypothetical protein